MSSRSFYARLFKRIVDVILSCVFLVMAAPLFLIFGLLIAISSKGPIIYRSKRIGYQGTPFYCLKFRTMRRNADELLSTLLKTSAALKAEWKQHRKLKKDPRITFIGKFLRKTSLDELPQLINILRGEMSFVGPRPVTEEEIDEYFGKVKADLLHMKPGLTGIWQMSGRSNLSYEERVALEISYAHKCSFFFDIKIILKTLLVPFFGKGAY